MGSTSGNHEDVDDSERQRAAHAAAAGLSAGSGHASKGAGSALSLRWHDYPEAVVSTLRMLKEDEDFVDVTLACNSSQQFTAHKVVLSACSPYFRKLLKSCGSNHPIIVLSNVSEDDLRALLKFMYNGQVQIAEDHLKDFLKTAEALQIRGLTDGTATRDTANIAQSPIAAPPSRGSSGLSLEPQAFARHQGFDNIHDNGLPPNDMFGPPSAKRYKVNGPRSENSSPGAAADRRWMMREAQSADAIGTSLLSQALEKQSNMRGSDLAEAMKEDHHRRQMENDCDDEDDEDEASDVTSERPESLIDGLVKSESLGAGGLSEMGNGMGSALHRQLSSPATTSASNPLFPPALEALYRQAGFPPAFLGLAAGGGGPPNVPGSGLSVQSVGLQSHAGNPNSKLDMMRVRATDPRPCPKCGKIYRSAHTLRTHMEDKHTICTGYRCVLCGTVAKSRNSLHSHMSRQHRGISTKDLPVLPMPSPFDADLASRLLAKAGVKVSPSELAARASPTATRRGDSHKMESGGGFIQHMQQQFSLPTSLSASSTSGLLHPGDVEDLRMTPASSPFGGHRASPSLNTHIRSPPNINAKEFAALAGGAAAGLGPAAAAAAAAAGGMGSALLDTYLQMIAAAGATDGGMAAAFGFQNPASRAAAFAAAAAAAANAGGNGAPPTNGDGRRSDDSRRSYSVDREEDMTGELGSDAENDEEEATSDPDGDAMADSLDRAKMRLEEAAAATATTATTMGSN